MLLINRILNSSKLKRLKRKLALSTGFYLKPRRFSPLSSENYRTAKILKTLQIDNVLDVGANTGQFAESLLDYGYAGRIVSFEPTSLARTILIKNAEGSKNWEVAHKFALGNHSGNLNIYLSQDSQFNSAKQIDQRFTAHFKESAVMDTEEVELRTLDSLIGEYYETDTNIFLKIDTQGFEKEVLEGATELIKHVKGVKIEVPLQFIYKNVDWGLTQIVSFFDERGFACASISEISANKKSGFVQEVDAIFVKKEALSYWEEI